MNESESFTSLLAFIWGKIESEKSPKQFLVFYSFPINSPMQACPSIFLYISFFYSIEKCRLSSSLSSKVPKDLIFTECCPRIKTSLSRRLPTEKSLKPVKFGSLSLKTAQFDKCESCFDCWPNMCRPLGQEMKPLRDRCKCPKNPIAAWRNLGGYCHVMQKQLSSEGNTREICVL